VRCRGSALLAVLWVSAALAAIAFSLSTTVRGETDRTSTDLDGLRSYYLASGGIQRATYELLWSTPQPPEKRLIPLGATHVHYTFPSGEVLVDIVPEMAKLNVNSSPPEELYKLGLALGLGPERAQEIAQAIIDWRTPVPPDQGGALDSYYLSLTPSFRARHTSFEEIEELLLVKGITPDIFYGTYVPLQEGGGGPRLAPRPGLIDCLSVFGSRDRVDANTAVPAVLAAVGVPPDAINALVERRRTAPLTAQQLSEFLQAYGLPDTGLGAGGGSIFTLRATARLRLPNGQLSDLRRSLGAQIKYMQGIGSDAPVHILRWYDMLGSN
jgi:general secretion pathway protein K